MPARAAASTSAAATADPLSGPVRIDGVRVLPAITPDTKARGVLFGALAATANRTGVPVTLLRLGYFLALGLVVSLLLGGKPAGVLVLALLAGVYIGLGVLLKPGDAGAPDRGAGWPESAPPKPAWVPEGELPYQREFIAYLWQGSKAPRQQYLSSSHGFVLSGLKKPPGRPHETVPGKYATRMPFGRMLVYDGWLVFLSDSRIRPGEVPGWSRVWWSVLEQLREARKWVSVLRVSLMAYDGLTKDQRERMLRLLGNPNSFFVPLDTVVGVRYERHLSAPGIRVITTDRELLFAPNGFCEWHIPSSVRVTKGRLGPWQPQLNRILERAALENRRRLGAVPVEAGQPAP